MLDRVTEYTRTYCDIKDGRRQEKQLQGKLCNGAVEKVLSCECVGTGCKSVDQMTNQRDARSRVPRAQHIPTQEAYCGYCGLLHRSSKCPPYDRIAHHAASRIILRRFANPGKLLAHQLEKYKR